LLDVHLDNNMTLPAIRYRKIDCGIGKHVPISIITEISKKRATHVSLHANNIHSLDLCLPQYQIHQRKNKEDESFRTGEFSLQHLLELDLSSNCLHEGYALTRLHVPKKVSLLGLCSNSLLTLNLASNGLNEHSFGNMIEMCSGGVEKSYFLARLCTLDISHNSFTVLPRKLHDLCPSLKHLAAVNNKIKSLTTLLKELHTLRGQLESLQLIDNTTTSTTNLVCSKELYQEKIIFLLGTQFVRLDGCNINNNARENARLKLERGLDIHPRFSAGVTKAKDRTQSLSRENDRTERHERVEFSDHGEVGDNETHEKITSLEAQVASLSATIESYVTSSKSCVASRCRDETGPVCDSNEVKLCMMDKPELQHSNMRQREKAAARFLFIVVSRKRNKALVYMAFSLWLVLTRFDRYIKRSKVRQRESETKWMQQTEETVDQAVKDEAEKCKRNIDHFRMVLQESEESISRLTREVEDLEKRLQNEKRNQRKCEAVFNETSEVMKYDIHRLEAELKKHILENKENIRDSETESNKLHEKLQSLTELLTDERRGRAEVESENKDLKIAYDEAKSRLAEDAALLKQLKLEVVSKEVSVYKSSVVANDASLRCSRSCHLHRKLSNQSKTPTSMQQNGLQWIGRDVNKLWQRSKKQKICFIDRQPYYRMCKLRHVVMSRITSRNILANSLACRVR
jgi:hypothetical protein